MILGEIPDDCSVILGGGGVNSGGGVKFGRGSRVEVFIVMCTIIIAAIIGNEK